MAIQINELIIRTTVTDDGSDSKAASGPSPKAKEQKKSSTESIINECVEKVLEILREQKER
ncbi:MAG: hypothetical protein HC845_15020 [Akkermansiaceae bacterium]|nr:hypothetical protein [Akkermansiaceae bacterium]